MSQRVKPGYSVYRKPFLEHHGVMLSQLSVHILLLKCDGMKFPRNPNAHPLELFCMTNFYGPLLVAFSKNKEPYQLTDFYPEHLKQIKQINLKEKRSYPPPLNTPIEPKKKTIKGKFLLDMLPKDQNRNLLAQISSHLREFEKCPELYLMFRFKTQRCQF